MLKKLADIATKLDELGWTKEADFLDSVIVKMAAGAPVTTGVPGASYSGGIQTTEGYPGGPSEKWYASAPKSLAELNKKLAALIQDNPTRFTSEARDLVEYLKTQTGWTDVTQKAWELFCAAINIPQAGNDWVSYAKGNHYAPTIEGVYAFWGINTPRLLGSFGDRGEANLSDLGKEPHQVTTESEQEPARTGTPDTYVTNPKNQAKFINRVYAQITAGSGTSELGPLHSQINNKLNSLTSAYAINWFRQSVDTILPMDLIKKVSKGSDTFAGWVRTKTGNEDVIEIYNMLDEAKKAADQIRKRSKNK